MQLCEGLWAWPAEGVVRSTSYPTLLGCKCLLRNRTPRVVFHDSQPLDLDTRLHCWRKISESSGKVMVGSQKVIAFYSGKLVG